MKKVKRKVTVDIDIPVYDELKELINKHYQIVGELGKNLDRIEIKTAEYKEYQKKRKKENPRVRGSWISENYLNVKTKLLKLLVMVLFQQMKSQGGFSY